MSRSQKKDYVERHCTTGSPTSGKRSELQNMIPSIRAFSFLGILPLGWTVVPYHFPANGFLGVGIQFSTAPSVVAGILLLRQNR